MSVSVKYVSCLRDAVYQVSISLTQLFYKELSTVNCTVLIVYKNSIVCC